MSVITNPVRQVDISNEQFVQPGCNDIEHRTEQKEVNQFNEGEH